MNKTLIALAIAAALPVAAQADATFSGSLTSKYKNTDASVDTDARLQLDASEVLANGMTATATFAVVADSDDIDTGNSGTASLSGGFGALTAGSIDADGAFQAGDIGGVVADTTEGTSSTASTVSGFHYAAGDLAGVAGLSIAAQVNANSFANGSTESGLAYFDPCDAEDDVAVVADEVPLTDEQLDALTDAQKAALNAAEDAKDSCVNKMPNKSTQIGVSYEVTDDLKVGFSTASASAANVAGGGVMRKQTAFGAAYTFGDLVVSAGKVNFEEKNPEDKSPDALISATYTFAAGPLTVVTQVDNDGGVDDDGEKIKSDYQIDISYAVSDSLTIASEIDKDKDTSLVATYVYGNMTAIVARTDDSSLDASIALDYGNADLTLGRVGNTFDGDGEKDDPGYTHVTYKVAF